MPTTWHSARSAAASFPEHRRCAGRAEAPVQPRDAGAYSRTMLATPGPAIDRRTGPSRPPRTCGPAEEAGAPPPPRPLSVASNKSGTSTSTCGASWTRVSGGGAWSRSARAPESLLAGRSTSWAGRAARRGAARRADRPARGDGRPKPAARRRSPTPPHRSRCNRRRPHGWQTSRLRRRAWPHAADSAELASPTGFCAPRPRIGGPRARDWRQVKRRAHRPGHRRAPAARRRARGAAGPRRGPLRHRAARAGRKIRDASTGSSRTCATRRLRCAPRRRPRRRSSNRSSRRGARRRRPWRRASRAGCAIAATPTRIEELTAQLGRVAFEVRPPHARTLLSGYQNIDRLADTLADRTAQLTEAIEQAAATTITASCWPASTAC